MKKNFLYYALICTVVIFSSCKKDKNEQPADTNYYMSADMNGTPKTFSTDATAVSLHISTANSLNISAYGGDDHKEIFLLAIQQENSIGAGTYANGGAAQVLGGYNAGSTDQSLVYNSGFAVNGDPALKIIISKATSTSISGTFSGTYYDNGGDGPGVLAITNGKFNVPLH